MFHLADRMGFEAPTLIQAQAIPVILSGKHVYDSLFICSFDLFVFEFLAIVSNFVACLFLSHYGKFSLVNAATGTGKTVAYLAPIIHHLQKYDPRIERSDGTFGMCFSVKTAVLPLLNM